MSGRSKMSFSHPTPDQLHTLVLDYLCHSCYTQTAAAFSKDNPTRHLDADGDEILTDGSSSNSVDEMLKHVRLRQEIRREILCGRVEEAIVLLNKHFPSVLAEKHPTKTTPIDDDASKSDSEHHPVISNLEYVSSTSTEPAHLLLNLRILAFCEACRTVPLNYSPGHEPKVDPGPINSLGDTKIESKTSGFMSTAQERQMELLLLKAQKLYALTNMLPNSADQTTYLKELKNVSGLLAYPVPENSSIASYLTMERREAVADQINRAILERTGRPLISSLELITRYTTVLWSYANSHGIKPRPGAVIPPKSITESSAMDVDNGNNSEETVPTFDLQEFLESKP